MSLIKNIEDVTLVAVATTEVEATAKALEYSTKKLKFERVLLLSHYNPKPESNFYEHIQISEFDNVGEWGKFIVFELYKYIQTKHIMLIHADGFIVNPNLWDNIFLDYDYIGAPWPIPKDNFSYRDYYGNIIRMGNSVSLRSKRLLELPSRLKLDWQTADHGYFHEDGFICVQNRHILQDNGINFAPLSVACRFSREKPILENKGIEPFAFHKWEGENSKYPQLCQKTTYLYKLNRVLNRLKKRI